MGRYLNPRNTAFIKNLNSEIYIDKSLLLNELNKRLNTNKCFIASTRPRRFGKSMNLQMIAAYYNLAHDSHALFEGSEISKCKSYETYINKFDVLWLDVLSLIDEAQGNDNIIPIMQKVLVDDIKETYGEYVKENSTTVVKALYDIYTATGKQFVILMDEWDAIFRKYKDKTALHAEYVEFLRTLFKGKMADEVVALAYITGILPIKKYGTESALNNFQESTMLNSGFLSPYVGFTKADTEMLCSRYGLDFSDIQKWYDGYLLNGFHVFNPNSIVLACENGVIDNYWTQTETFEALRDYITRDFQGLREDVTSLLAGNRIAVRTTSFKNDFLNINSKDDVLTLLIHLGYLTYDFKTKEAYIPNYEVRDNYVDAILDTPWTGVKNALRESRDLLSATLSIDSETVASILEKAHEGTCSVIKYNDENSLACALSIAYYSARDEYVMERELPTGKGFADIVMLPRKDVNKPAIIVELKYRKSAQGAIEQIKKRNYPAFVAQYTGEILLVGVNYESDSKSENYKKHSCVIEKYNLD